MNDNFQKIAKINKLLTNKQLKALFKLFIVLSFGVFLEMLSIGLILPLLSSLNDKQNTYVTRFLDFFNLHNKEFNPILILLCVFISVFILKTITLTYLTFRKNKFLQNLSATLSSNLFTHYVNQDYSFHIKNSSSIMIKNIRTEISSIMSFIQAYVNFSIELCFTLSIIIFLMFLQIYFTLILGGFFIIAIGLFYFLTQSKIKSLGVQRFNIDSKLATTLHETFEGIKAVKLSSLQQITIKHYSSMCYKKASYVSKKDTLSQIPLYYLELVSLLSLAIIIVYVKYYTIEGLSAIPVIIVFAAAGLKLVPSANKLIAIGQTLKFYNFSFDTIASELANINNNNCFDSDPKKLIFNDKIIFSLVSYKFENKENYILKNLNFSIYRNDCIGILGKSGSGKTTFLELLSGLAKPSNGSITVNGFSIYDNPKQWVNICSYVPQNVFLFNDSILSNIILGDRGKNHDINLLNELIIGLGLDEIINTLPNGINSVVGDRGVTLSGGQIQRIGIARAIYSRPSLLILDEATSALDNFSEKMIIKFICENLSFTKIIISHNLESFKFCNKIFELNNFNLTNISDER